MRAKNSAFYYSNSPRNYSHKSILVAYDISQFVGRVFSHKYSCYSQKDYVIKINTITLILHYYISLP